MKTLKFSFFLFISLFILLLTGCPSNNPLTFQNAAIAISDSDTIYLSATSTATLTIANTSSSVAAQDITAMDLPAQVTSSSCTANAKSTCTLTLTSTGAMVGNTVIHLSGKNTNTLNATLAILRILLILGANSSLQDQNGDTALNLAIKFDRKNCVKMLKAYDAK